MTRAHASHGLLAGRLLVCLGPGGVGKTTVSAALALDAALARRRVDVMTVDPAPRLLDALGLGGVDAAEPREVPLGDVQDTQDVQDAPDAAEEADVGGSFELADASHVRDASKVEERAAERAR